ncbi:D-alanyl-lipoteichoic acid acyltransferase DltB, MBOAT superfamily [Pontibacter indicus]|uniref:D-alanyl-lipoteichoic acid acyltransferase DltB, MBOAT superfamily n=2 Tax=Pontibacter indicus TaxID=1317125 RepID=A0A1R3WE11_9BACT|nr:D-alanyl-lipoteichoic acid acyltransferase DltB, MBOAT superfamily [Pontibacter indicus]
MLFNSFLFLLFFPSICVLYFLLPYRYRWILLLVGSYYFYMNWIPVYALLLFLSTLITYVCALLISNSEDQSKKKAYLIFSLVSNFSILFFFKYFNFINTSVFELLTQFNLRWEVPNLKILLPVGISFYTFQAVGYSIDVYRGELKPEKHLGIYALFVSYFPQLVAGPIERATNLLPQFRQKFDFDYTRVVQGLKLMLWGFFMKLVVADRLAIYVDAVYNNADKHDGLSLIIATLFFTVQIYGDFAGYSYISIGSARIMGFNLMMNFNQPYFSKSIAEFWSRWHISLSTWFRDYVYISLGGNRVSFHRWQLNLLITFLVSGIWHGANWTFVIWGTLHGLFLIFSNITKKYIFRQDYWQRLSNNSSLYQGFQIITTIILVAFTWILFRANNVSDAFLIISKIFTTAGVPFLGDSRSYMMYALMSIVLLFTVEYIREYYPNLTLLDNESVQVRYISYTAMAIIIMLFGVFDGGQFIYFQF